MMRIGKSYIERRGGTAYLCADVTIRDRRNTLWFAVDESQEKYLAAGRADPFVMVMLPVAMEKGGVLRCDDLMSERLNHQLCTLLIPALASVGGRYKALRIEAPLTAEARPSAGAVGTGFSGGVDSLYTIMTHGPDSEYPLTHIAVFNCSNFQIHGRRSREEFQKNCRTAEQFAAEFGFRTVFVDTNFQEALGKVNPDTVGVFRRAGCILALDGLFSVWLLSSAYAATYFSMNLESYGEYEPLIAHCIHTETVRFYTSGQEAKRWEKLEALSGWEPSWRWLHSCYGGVAGEMNCGCCKKCKRNLAVLYGLGKLDRYRGVYDVDRYLARLPENLAYVYLGAGKDTYLKQAVGLFADRHVPIPPEVWLLQERLGGAIGRMKAAKESKNGN